MKAEATQGTHAPLRYARLLHLLTSQEKMLMVMASHPGPSHHAAPQRTGWAMAGLLAGLDTWEEFEERWRVAHSRGWQDGNLARLMGGYQITGIAGAWRDAGEPIPPLTGGMRLGRKIRDPHLICFEHCVIEATRHLNGLAAGETVSFVMDWNEPLASSALWGLEDLKNLSAPPIRERLGALGFEGRDTFLPLQAAEWLARRCYERLQDPTCDAEHFSPPDEHWIRWTLLDGTTPGCVPKGAGLAWKQSSSRP